MVNTMLIRDFFQKAESCLNPQQNSIKDIKPKINEFISFFGNVDVQELTTEKITNYVSFLQKIKNKPATINAKLTYLHKYLSFAYSENLITKMPKITFLKIRRQKPAYITKTDFLKICKWCKNRQQQEFRQLCHLLYFTGARVQNVLDLTPQDITKNGITFEKNKTNTPYTVPIARRLKPAIKHFRPFTMNYQHAYYIFNLIKNELKLNRKYTLHKFRHAFCTTLAEKGVHIVYIAELANHKNITTTRLYVQGTSKALCNAVNLL